MKLDVYIIEGHTVDIRPASPKRPWMDATSRQFAYRCLPLNIANCFGWEIYCPEGFMTAWRGGDALDDLIVIHDNHSTVFAGSHFGHGVLTFTIPCLFKTDPDISLMVQGPINTPKDGIQALAGVVETDWAPYTFTMNWKFTRPGYVRFEKGEPFCHIFPVSCSDIENVEPKIKSFDTDPKLKEEYTQWSLSRKSFIEKLYTPGSEEQEKGWQKNYFRGQTPSGCPVHGINHRTKLKLKEFS